MEENNKPKILYVDDEENNLIVFKSSFRRYFDVYVSTSGAEGLKILQENDIDVIITDQRMPGMTGVEFLKQLPEDLMSIRMILTGFSDVAAIIEAINLGKVYRYITKPWDKDELKITIDNAVEALALRRNNLLLISELREANEQLEQKVIERTSDLQKALNQINDQKKELEDLNATKDKFFSIVAHDLRNPISSLSSFSYMLSEYSEEMTQKEIIDLSKELNKATKNALNLVENLLTWAYSQMKKVNHAPQVVNISALVSETLSQLATTANSKQISLEENLTPDLQVYADVDQLRLILQNITTNAIKFTDQGGKVSVSTAYGASSEAEISVSDTGVGMSPEKLAALFKIGHAQNTNGTEGERGTGLGLILCKEFIEKNGGKIAVSSKEGEGTTFTIRLKQPLKDDHSIN
jgi:two-component system sensor histidine kinase/response regulator